MVAPRASAHTVWGLNDDQTARIAKTFILSYTSNKIPQNDVVLVCANVLLVGWLEGLEELPQERKTRARFSTADGRLRNDLFDLWLYCQYSW